VSLSKATVRLEQARTFRQGYLKSGTPGSVTQKRREKRTGPEREKQNFERGATSGGGQEATDFKSEEPLITEAWSMQLAVTAHRDVDRKKKKKAWEWTGKRSVRVAAGC